MDHLPRPPGSVVPLIEVPFLAYIPYDFRDFNEFPARHGFTREGKLDFDRAPAEIASCLQSWLFFGLIAEFVKIYSTTPFDVHDYTNPERTLVSTTRLKDVLVQAEEDRENRAKHTAIWPHLGKAAVACASFNHSAHGNTPPIPRICLSVQILIDTFYINIDYTIAFRPMSLVPSTQLIIDQMTASGWCPFQIQQLYRSVDYITLTYISQLRRRVPDYITHQDCSPEQCIGNNVDMTRYKTRHIQDGCKCLNVSPPVEDVTEIVAKGGVPLLSIHPQAHGNIELHISKATNETDYVAFSHVWSNGLGNPQNNSLPQCQLEYFADAFGKAGWHRDRLFWIDTLCIPVKHDALKTKAINQMGFIYTAASAVVVLDAELQQISINRTADNSHMLALQAHILASAWMGRSWTLQEGALARKCYFAFADGIQGIEKMWADLDAHKKKVASSNSGLRHRVAKLLTRNKKIDSDPLGSVLQAHVLYLLTQACKESLQSDWLRGRECDFAGVAMPLTELSEFVKLWNALGTRSTTQPDDIPGIIATLLGFHTFQILAFGPEERIRQMLWSMKYVPLSLLYNTGPRLKQDQPHKDRWVPTVPSGCFLFEQPFMQSTEEHFFLDSRGHYQKGYPHHSISLRQRLLPNYFRKHPHPWKTLPTIIRTPACMCLSQKASLSDPHTDWTYLIEFLRTRKGACKWVQSTGATACETDPHKENCFLIEALPQGTPPIGSVDLRGACLYPAVFTQSHRGGEDVTQIRARYECPIRVQLIFDTRSCAQPSHALPIIQGETPLTWTLALEREPTGFNGPCSRRPIVYHHLLHRSVLICCSIAALLKVACDVVLSAFLGLNITFDPSNTYASVLLGLYLGAYFWLTLGFLMTKLFRSTRPFVPLSFAFGLQSLGAMILFVLYWTSLPASPFFKVRDAELYHWLFRVPCALFFSWFAVCFVFAPLVVRFLKPIVYAAWLATFEKNEERKRTWRLIYALIRLFTFLTPLRD